MLKKANRKYFQKVLEASKHTYLWLFLGIQTPQALVFSNTYRKSAFVASGAALYTRITYEFKSSSNSNAGAMNMGTGVFTAPIDGTYMFSVHAQRVSSEISGIIKCGKQDNLDMCPYPAHLPLAIPDIHTVLFAK